MRWPTDPSELEALQQELAELQPQPWTPSVGVTTGGCFVCYGRGGEGSGIAGDRGWASAVVMAWRRRLASSEIVSEAGGDLIAFVFSPYGLLWLAAGVFLFVIMPFRDGQRELKLAIAEYGYHLRSHTEILKSMSLASQELAATTEQLRQSVVQGSNASSWATMQTRSSPNSGELTALPEPQSGPVSTGTTTTTGADETPQLPTAAKRRREKRRGVSRRRPSGRHRA